MSGTDVSEPLGEMTLSRLDDGSLPWRRDDIRFMVRFESKRYVQLTIITSSIPYPDIYSGGYCS